MHEYDKMKTLLLIITSLFYILGTVFLAAWLFSPPGFSKLGLAYILPYHEAIGILLMTTWSILFLRRMPHFSPKYKLLALGIFVITAAPRVIVEIYSYMAQS
jgi:hypothetical protein